MPQAYTTSRITRATDQAKATNQRNGLNVRRARCMSEIESRGRRRLMKLRAVSFTSIVEHEGSEALNEFRVGDDDADDARLAPEQRQLAVLVAAHRHRPPRRAVSQHRDLDAHVRPQWSVAAADRARTRPPPPTAVSSAAVDVVVVVVPSPLAVRRRRRRRFDEAVEGEVDALAGVSVDGPRTQRTGGAALLGQRRREEAGRRRRSDRSLSVARRPITSFHCITPRQHSRPLPSPARVLFTNIE